MRRTLTFHRITFDVQRVGPGTFPGTLSFFTQESDGTELAPSVRDVHEGAIVKWLLGHQQCRWLICSQLGLPATVVHRVCVTEPVLEKRNTKPGDIDWLCGDPERPDLALAAECKRVKVLARKEGEDHVNKIESLRDGVVQVNALAGLGIHHTFLVILLVVDGRVRTENNVVFRGVADAKFRDIYDFPLRDKLADEVGLVFIEIVQPSARSINGMGSVGICVDRPAKPREQTTTMTNRIRAVLNRPE
jgi:hypothetical protein